MNQSNSAADRQLVINTTTGTFVIKPADIVRLEACSNYTYIHLKDKRTVFASKVLKYFEPMLLPFGFIRTHKTHLINRRFITFVSPSGKIRMEDNSVIEVSRRKRSNLRMALA